MPEELAIILGVLFVAGWIIFVLVRTVAKSVSEVQRTFTEGIEANRLRRFKTRKARYASTVRFSLPGDLSKAERDLERLESEFQHRRTQTKWTPVRPAWERRPFLKQMFSPQNSFCSEMNISELNWILSPEAEAWSEREAKLVSQDCTYPGAPPTGTSIDDSRSYLVVLR
jgi:hypothetical protein